MSKRVLIVDDDLLLLQLLEGILRKDGYQVQSASDIQQALRLVQRLPPDAAILDVELAAHSMVVMSSHNLVLAPLLESHLEALRIVRDSANQLAIESGVLVETNGINMMKNYNIPKSVFQNAQLIHEWYSSYVLTPNEFPKLK